jgi:hypothetical protein
MSQIQMNFEFHAFGMFKIWWNLERKLLIAPSCQETYSQEIWGSQRKILVIDLKIWIGNTLNLGWIHLKEYYHSIWFLIKVLMKWLRSP